MKRLLILLTFALPCFAARAQFLLGASPAVPQYARGAAAWADYNGGGPDLLLCGMDSAGVRHTVLLQNTGNSLVPDLAQNLLQVSDGDAAWGDMDNDGDFDLVLTGETAPRQSVTQVYRNVSGLLQPVATGLPGLSMGRAVWGDLDHDGDKDIFLTGFNEAQGFLGIIARNDGNGVFTTVTNPLFATREWTAAAVGDYDNDGLPDIAFADISPLITEGMRCVVLHNLGGMRFAPVAGQLPGF